MTRKKIQLTNLVQTRIPTRHGEFTLHYYNNNLDHKEHIALIKGEVSNKVGIPVRIHSECFTGDVLGSRRCDCGEQLDMALQLIEKANCGIFIYLRQEGRGIGLLKKLQAYNLQDEGLDTVDANLHLGHLADEREYDIAALMLKDLKANSVSLITNNPKKILARHLAVHDRFWDSCRKNRFTARRINRLQTPCVRLDYAQKPLRQGSHKWLDGYSG